MVQQTQSDLVEILCPLKGGDLIAAGRCKVERRQHPDECVDRGCAIVGGNGHRPVKKGKKPADPKPDSPQPKPAHAPTPSYTDECKADGHKPHHRNPKFCMTCIGRNASRQKKIDTKPAQSPKPTGPKFPYTDRCKELRHRPHKGGKACYTCNGMANRERFANRKLTPQHERDWYPEPQHLYTDECKQAGHEPSATGLACKTCQYQEQRETCAKMMEEKKVKEEEQPTLHQCDCAGKDETIASLMQQIKEQQTRNQDLQSRNDTQKCIIQEREYALNELRQIHQGSLQHRQQLLEMNDSLTKKIEALQAQVGTADPVHLEGAIKRAERAEADRKILLDEVIALRSLAMDGYLLLIMIERDFEKDNPSNDLLPRIRRFGADWEMVRQQLKVAA